MMSDTKSVARRTEPVRYRNFLLGQAVGVNTLARHLAIGLVFRTKLVARLENRSRTAPDGNFFATDSSALAGDGVPRNPMEIGVNCCSWVIAAGKTLL